MHEPVYRVPGKDLCPVCGGQTKAAYYRVKGIVPWVFCQKHGLVRDLIREEHRRYMAGVEKGS